MKTQLKATTQTGVVVSSDNGKELIPFWMFLDMLHDLKDDEAIYTEATPEQICKVQNIYGIN